jgi:P-type Cu+ transporter
MFDLPIFIELQVAGNFTYGVMALSAGTYTFWSMFGSQLVPAAIQHGGTMSLALQLSCSALVWYEEQIL